MVTNFSFNGKRYRAIINDFFGLELEDIDVDHWIWQATKQIIYWRKLLGIALYRAEVLIKILRFNTGQNIFGVVMWSRLSILINLIAANCLEENSWRIILDIWLQLLQKLVENKVSRHNSITIISRSI